MEKKFTAVDNCCKGQQDNKEILDYLLEQEKKHRETIAIEKRMKRAVFPVKKTLEEFDFGFQRLKL